jgi:outer membrane protein assembly factor BamB
LGVLTNYAGYAPDGKPRWTWPTAGFVEASPALTADGTFWCGAKDGIVFSLSADLKWGWGVNELAWIVASPVIAPDGMVYAVSYNRQLNAIRAHTGPLANSSWPMFRADARHTGRVRRVK